MSYTHIFTDGVDKLLSASIWFMWYGGKDAFCFYEHNALKGYVEDNEYKRLAIMGGELLKDEVFIQELFRTATELSKEFETLYSKLNHKSSKNIETLAHISLLLKKLYKNYFFTEEYYTNCLDPSEDSVLIEKIGRFRYENIKTCVQLTKYVHDLAHDIVGKNAEFYMIDEILKKQDVSDLDQRNKAFLLIQKDHKLKLFSGKEAKNKYKSLSQETNRTNLSKLSGMPASKGRVTGFVYKVSLTSKNLPEQINTMPEGAVLITESTQPQMTLACKKASAIVTDEGGILSHAAILSRGYCAYCERIRTACFSRV